MDRVFKANPSSAQDWLFYFQDDLHEPDKIISGDSASWLESHGLYPAPSWTLKYELRGPNKITITAVQDGVSTGWKVDLHSVDTVDWTPAIYTFQAYATNAADRHTLWTGTIEVGVDLAEVADLYSAAQSHVRQTLALIETAIQNYMGTPYARIVIAGREKENVDMTQLVKLRARYRYYLDQELRREKIAKGIDAGGRVLTRFVSPS